MCGACSTHEGDGKCMQNGVRKSGARDHSEHLDVRGRSIMEMNLTETWWVVVDWIRLAEDRDHWRAFVNAAVSLQVP
jgi:hypothetical protein